MADTWTLLKSGSLGAGDAYACLFSRGGLTDGDTWTALAAGSSLAGPDGDAWEHLFDRGTGSGEQIEEGLPDMRPGVGIPWNDAPAKSRQLSAGWIDAPALAIQRRTAWAPQQVAADRAIDLLWAEAFNQDRQWRSAWARFARMADHEITAIWQAMRQVDSKPIRSPWGELHPVECKTAFPWQSPPAKETDHLQIPWGDGSTPVDYPVAIPYGYGQDTHRSHRTCWGKKYYEAICFRRYQAPDCLALAFNLDTPIEEVDDGTHIHFYFDSLSYDLRCDQREPSGWRDRYDPLETFPRTPTRKIYLIMNTALLTRVIDNEPIEVIGMDISSDIDSWCWGFTGTLRTRAALDLCIDPANPVAVRADINGYSWIFLIESWAESRSFGRRTYTIKGRSQSAELTAPYTTSRSYVATSAANAVQICEAELTGSGWTLTWGLDDWLIPASVYSYINKTPLQAIQQVLQAPGAVLQSDPVTKTLYALSRYPTPPWDWGTATPALGLGEAIIRQLSHEWTPGQQYNAVFVSGENQGVVVKVYREGSAGDIVAPMVTDALITATEPAHERGRVELGKSGKWGQSSILLPLTASPDLPGLLSPGTLVELTEGGDNWRAQVIGCRIAVRRSGALRIEQTATLERYHGD